jgi:hypothetical protein
MSRLMTRILDLFFYNFMTGSTSFRRELKIKCWIVGAVKRWRYRRARDKGTDDGLRALARDVKAGNMETPLSHPLRLFRGQLYDLPDDLRVP